MRPDKTVGKMFYVYVTDSRIVRYFVSAQDADEAREKVEMSLDPDEDFGYKIIHSEWGVDDVEAAQ